MIRQRLIRQCCAPRRFDSSRVATSQAFSAPVQPLKLARRSFSSTCRSAKPFVLWLWPTSYPVGNTPAVSLTTHLPPEEAANVLLLGCGNPRSILFTVFSDGNEILRPLDFTCCDIDSSILGQSAPLSVSNLSFNARRGSLWDPLLARNVVLLSLLFDSAPHDRIWSLFYEFYVDQETLNLLSAHSVKLYHASASIDQWNSSHYSRTLRMCSSATLESLRRHWKQYAEVKTMSPTRMQLYVNKFEQGIKNRREFLLPGMTMSLCEERSSGPLLSEACRPKLGRKTFKKYWETGVTTGNPILERIPNPMFAYSARGEEFTAHCGTNPALGFHLALRFAVQASDRNTSSSHQDNFTNRTLSIAEKLSKKLQQWLDKCCLGTTAYDSFLVAKAEFSEWCGAFQTRIRIKNITSPLIIRFFCGDMAAFTTALHALGKNGSRALSCYSSPWSLRGLTLDSADYGESAAPLAPCRFNVIDTSNLIDHLGVLNVLIHAQPLLIPGVSSSLYTETMNSQCEVPAEYLREQLCGDVALMTVLLGIAPTACSSPFTTTGNSYDAVIAFKDKSRLFHERLCWKPVCLDDTLVTGPHGILMEFHPHDFAKVLFNIYKEMFWRDNPTIVLRKILSNNQNAVKSTVIFRYTRQTFSHLLALLKRRVSTNWDTCIKFLLRMIREDKFLVESIDHYDDLLLQLYLQGVSNSIPQTPSTLAPLDKLRNQQERFKDWRSIPPAITLTMEVPRDVFKLLPESKMFTPVLQIEIWTGFQRRVFSSFHMSFGTITKAHSGELEVLEDPDGWMGTSPLLVSLSVPSAVLASALGTTRVCLSVTKNVVTGVLLRSTLGPHLHLFQTDLTDTKRIFLSQEPPNIAKSSSSPSNQYAPVLGDQTSGTSKQTTNAFKATLNSSATAIETLSVHLGILDSQLKSQIRGRAMVSTSQSSPYSINATVGATQIAVPFPLPIRLSGSRTNLHRKGSSIEIMAPVSKAHDRHSCASTLHSLTPSFRSGNPLAWNVHYLNLDVLPRLERDPKYLGWVKEHLKFTFSPMEHASMKSVSALETSDESLLINIKQTLGAIILGSSGLHLLGKVHSVFALEAPNGKRLFAYIFVTDIRLDLSAHTLVLDCCVMPLTPELRWQTRHLMLSRDNPCTVVRTSEKEYKGWMRLLPAFAERCRTWKHLPTCEYLRQGAKHFESSKSSPLCSCAAGHPSKEFLDTPFKDLARYVTRAAISPLYPVLEDWKL